MYIKHFETKAALGSNATIVLVTNENTELGSLFQRLWREIFLFERRFSRFIPESELSRFNRQAGLKMVISQEFQELLEATKAMSKLSSGLYNPFILPALQRAGYRNSAMPGYENDHVDDHSNKSIVSIDRLDICDGKASIPYGTAIDMGGIGKGFLADKLANMLDQENLIGYWVSMGGDMVLSGKDDTGEYWHTNIQSASTANEFAPKIIQHHGQRLAVATSGTFLRKNQKMTGNNRWHHLIDPRTGQPAKTNVQLATVIDTLCVRADVLASCVAIVGSKSAVKYLQKTGVIGGYIQTNKNIDTSFGEMIITVGKKSSNQKVYA